jgi:hypothetical protein
VTPGGRAAERDLENKKEPETQGPVCWVKCPRFDVPPELQAALRAEGASIRRGRATPSIRGEMPPTVVLCPNGEEVDSEVRTIRQLTPESSETPAPMPSALECMASCSQGPCAPGSWDSKGEISATFGSSFSES